MSIRAWRGLASAVTCRAGGRGAAVSPGEARITDSEGASPARSDSLQNGDRPGSSQVKGPSLAGTSPLRTSFQPSPSGELDRVTASRPPPSRARSASRKRPSDDSVSRAQRTRGGGGAVQAQGRAALVAGGVARPHLDPVCTGLQAAGAAGEGTVAARVGLVEGEPVAGPAVEQAVDAALEAQAVEGHLVPVGVGEAAVARAQEPLAVQVQLVDQDGELVGGLVGLVVGVHPDSDTPPGRHFPCGDEAASAGGAQGNLPSEVAAVHGGPGARWAAASARAARGGSCPSRARSPGAGGSPVRWRSRGSPGAGAAGRLRSGRSRRSPGLGESGSPLSSARDRRCTGGYAAARRGPARPPARRTSPGGRRRRGARRPGAGRGRGRIPMGWCAAAPPIRRPRRAPGTRSCPRSSGPPRRGRRSCGSRRRWR